MWETCSVQLNVRLPQDMAEHVREVERSDPEFLTKLLLYGLTRRSIYQQLREGYPTPPIHSEGETLPEQDPSSPTS